MKTIQWYPGHMAKAMRLMEENMSLCDGVILVLDARVPASSFNPRIRDMVRGKPVLYLLNKGDLADGGADGAVTLLKENGAVALKFCATSVRDQRTLQAALNSLVQERAQKNLGRGFTRAMRFLVAGVPNTGKSTVINLLAGGKKAQTGDKAGVTKTKQWVRSGDIEFLDTPGTMPPYFENQTLARRLAYVGSVNDDILAMDEIALALLEELAEKYPDRLEERYGIGACTPLEMLEGVCRRRGFMLRGGEFDYERGERALLDDFRKGKLGRICLDSAEDFKSVGLI